VIGFVDEQQDFALFHEDPVAVLGDVLEVVDDADKLLLHPHRVAVAAAEAVEHVATITADEQFCSSKKKQVPRFCFVEVALRLEFLELVTTKKKKYVRS
jgi:hypothetical protein